MVGPRPLWITIDDYGLSTAGNAAIEDLVAQRRVSAVSVMTHDGAHLDGIDRLKHAGVAIGLHLVFTRERPLGLAGTRLVDGDGRLPRGWRRLFLALCARPWLARALGREAQAQRARFLGLGLPLAFVNAHEHAHLFPLLWREVAPLVEDSPGAGVRVAIAQALARSRQGMLALASRAAWRMRPIAGRAVLSPLGVDDSGHLAPAALPALLRAAARIALPAIAELVVHPSEHGLLMAPELPGMLLGHGFALAHRTAM